MRRIIPLITPTLRLTRITFACGAIANVWFVILWSRAHGDNEPATHAINTAPLWLLLLGGAAASLGLFTFATGLNDVLDRRRDRTRNPDRPLPRGEITPESAVALVISALLVSILGAAALGVEAVVLTVAVAAAVLFFNATARFVPAIGLVMLGLIYAGQMVVPNFHLVFVWPVWLVMTHALAVAAVTHRLGRRVPAISRRAWAAAFSGWFFWSLIILTSPYWRSESTGGIGELWPDFVTPFAAVGPIALVIGFVVFCYLRVRKIGPGQRAAEKVSRYGALWLAFYAAAWMIGVADTAGSLILTALAAAGVLGMTIVREAVALLEHPIDYRR